MNKKIPKMTRQVVAIVSIAGAVAIIALAYLLFWGQQLFNDLLFAAILMVLVPSAILDYLNQSWRKAINDRLPQLVRDLSEAQETGMTLIRALEEATTRKYGPLSDEVKKLVVQMSWGSSFEDAFKRFTDRIGTAVIRRFSAIVLEASRTGGRIRRVFSMTAESMDETLHLERERQSQMRPYTIIIYAAFFVFLFTTSVLLTSFFTPLEEVPMAGGFFDVGGGDIFKEFFYHMILMQALLGGLVAGKMGEGRVLSGLKHCIIIVVTGYIAFSLAVPS